MITDLSKDPLLTAKLYLRRAMAARFTVAHRGESEGGNVDVVSIDEEPSTPDSLWMHLSDGTTYILSIDVVQREGGTDE